MPRSASCIFYLSAREVAAAAATLAERAAASKPRRGGCSPALLRWPASPCSRSLPAVIAAPGRADIQPDHSLRRRVGARRLRADVPAARFGSRRAISEAEFAADYHDAADLATMSSVRAAA